MGEEVLNAQERLAKNGRIKKTRKATIARHEQMSCKTYELKVDLSHISNRTRDLLRRLFLEAKWFYNDMVVKDLVFTENPWTKTRVQVRLKDKTFENRNLNVLSSQMRQSMVARAKHAISGLSASKKNGLKVGALKPKKRVGSIPLVQYGDTFEIIGDKIRIANIGQLLRVRGLGQIPTTTDSEVASALLISTRDGNYLLHVTVYRKPVVESKPEAAAGCDAGVLNQMTVANPWDGVGIQIREKVPLTESLKRINRRFSKRQKGSAGRREMLRRLNAEYRHITNTRRDVRNKLTSTKSGLPSVYKTIATQKDHIKGWQKMWGTAVQTSAVGGMMAALRSKAHTPILVDRWMPTTQPCPRCGAPNADLRGLENLSNRTPECHACGFRTDRDVWAAQNDALLIPLAERKPVDTKAATKLVGYLNSIPHVEASLVETPTFDTCGKETDGRQAPSDGSHPNSFGGL